jgi:outer membrane protein OmpA-like peptidoglycan-associated protein
LIEGHTDALRSESTICQAVVPNMPRLSSPTPSAPFENILTQGYGEEFLKVPTLQAERANRRVAVRRITTHMARD